MSDDIKGTWRTVRGRRIFIKNGQSLTDAMRESGKFENNRSKQIQEKLKQQFNKNEELKRKPLETFEEKLEYIDKNQDKLYKIIEDSEKVDKDLCIALQEEIGFNGKPQLLNEQEFNQLSDKDYIKVYRGVHDGKETADKYIEQFKKGKNEYGDGDTAFGIGHYTTTEKNDANTYGKTIEIAIPKNTRIIEYDENRMNRHFKAYDKYTSNYEKYYNKYGDKTTSIMDSLNENESSTAILENYDIIKKTLHNESTGKDSTIYIILNRSKVIVKEENKHD